MDAHYALKALTLLDNLKEEAGTESGKAEAVKLLLTLSNNVITKGADEKYRSVKCGNKMFLSKVGLLPSGLELMEMLGFVRSGDVYVMESPKMPCAGVVRALKEAISEETIEEYSTAVTSSVVPSIALRDGDFTESDYETLLTLDNDVVKASPQSVITALKTMTTPSPSTCYVCLEALTTGEPCIMLGCGDTFHPFCIKRWAKESRLCPLCKKDLEA
eukprot:TRINITY_DN17029_c0_g1_i1.p1 TRINITY_DN17029_c0_g1~~TRINITY_DN17029_c0_g1_i1.p1  ORF type:complete len:231 (+),score=52.51 TRINITY_DN17029_c0_g1_i1:44-694(+)